MSVSEDYKGTGSEKVYGNLSGIARNFLISLIVPCPSAETQFWARKQALRQKPGKTSVVDPDPDPVGSGTF